MNEETPALTSSPASAQPAASAASAAPSDSSAGKPPAPAPRASGAAGWAVLLAVIAVGGAGLAGWQAWETRGRVGELREELASRLNAGDTVATEARAIARQQQETLAALQGKVGALEAKVEATEGQAAALEALYQEFSRSREDRVVAEVEQAITIAAQQLQLAGNLEAALIALQGAEARLALQDKGQLAPLRRALAKDIEQLKLLPEVDVGGVALRLERLLERADALPFAFESTLPESAEATSGTDAPAADGRFGLAMEFVSQFALDIWRELRALVRVERLDQSEPVLLAPAQSTYLRENLKIRLLTARLALLARDGRTYAADLAQARSWIERFFDTRDERVRNSIDELKVLEAVPVSAERPALTESFAALRVLQARSGDLRPAAPAQPASGGKPTPAAQPGGTPTAPQR